MATPRRSSRVRSRQPEVSDTSKGLYGIGFNLTEPDVDEKVWLEIDKIEANYHHEQNFAETPNCLEMQRESKTEPGTISSSASEDTESRESHRSRSDRASSEQNKIPTSNNRETDTTMVDEGVTADNRETKNIQLKTPGSDGERDRLDLAAWDLPPSVLAKYQEKGITHMFDWQLQCLTQGNSLSGRNLVYSAPTSAGKTMVAEILMIKRIKETRRKAIFILPFVSVSREKMFSLQKLYKKAGIRVGGFMGSHSTAGGLKSLDLAVCTIEKANSLVNKLIEDNRLDQLCIVVVDELHMVGDPHRGYLLELLLTKLRYATLKARAKQKEDSELGESSLSVDSDGVQIVGMSATLPNLGVVARWLDAELYSTAFRPVRLQECLKIGRCIYDGQMRQLWRLEEELGAGADEDEEQVTSLVLHTLLQGHSTLIFCPTKNWCEKLAEKIAKHIYKRLSAPKSGCSNSSSSSSRISEGLHCQLNSSALKDVLEQLKRTGVGLDQVLRKTVPYGSAYHHAGLTFDERDIIEGAFRTGALKVLVATSTLSSGVNLPARRVIIRTPLFNCSLLDVLSYKQMAGRAGRQGIDTKGESILICKPNQKSKALQLINSSELKPVQSCLVRQRGEEASSSMKRALLEVRL